MTALFILEAIIAFSLLVLVHELGHFLAAKWMGIRVDAFSLGFGPCLKKKWGDTEYRLSLVPLGGYVKMAGEEPTPDKPPQPHEFYSKSVGQRAIVFVAGVFMNLVSGFIIFIAAYAIGVPVMPAVVGGVEAGSPAWHEGLQVGDEIVAINGRKGEDLDFEDLFASVMLAGADESLRLVIQRDGEQLVKLVRPEYDPILGRKTVGIGPPFTLRVGERPPGDDAPKEPSQNGHVEPDWYAIFRAGLKTGDLITSVQGPEDADPKPVVTPMDVQTAVDESTGKPIRIFFLRDEQQQGAITVSAKAAGKPEWLGVSFGSNELAAVRKGAWAEKARLKQGDIVLSVAGQTTRSATDVREALDATASLATVVTVNRDSEVVELDVPARPGGEPAKDVVAFEAGLVVSRCWPGFPADEVGMRPGDEIMSAAGAPVRTRLELYDALVKAKGKPLLIGWKRDGREMSERVTPQRRWELFVPLAPRRKVVRKGFLGACALGTRKSVQWIQRIYSTLKGLLVGDISPKNLHGPITIGVITYQAAKTDFGLLLYFLGVLSVNLGILNLLPIPILDGGHLLFALIEKLRGRAVSEKVRAGASYVGLALLGSLMVLVFWNDISQLISGFLG